MQRKLTDYELVTYLEKLCESEAFEILPSSGESVAVPYIMNDAFECYITLRKVHLPAGIFAKPSEITGVCCVESGDRLGLILENEGNMLGTIWYQDAVLMTEFYMEPTDSNIRMALDE